MFQATTQLAASSVYSGIGPLTELIHAGESPASLLSLILSRRISLSCFASNTEENKKLH